MRTIWNLIMTIQSKLVSFELNSTIQVGVTIGSHNTQRRLVRVVRSIPWHESALHVVKVPAASVYNAMCLYVTQSITMDQNSHTEEIVSKVTFKPCRNERASEKQTLFRWETICMYSYYHFMIPIYKYNLYKLYICTKHSYLL